MPTLSPQTIYLKDYTAPTFWVDAVDLHFTLHPQATIVRAQLRVRRNGQHAQPLQLDGDGLHLLSLKVDGQDYPVDAYQASPDALVINALPDACTVEITTQINPAANTQLMGLYQSNGRYFTQCEAEGFRRIMYYLDRPDVLAVFTTTIVADATTCPVLLSNGNPVAQGHHADGTHWVTWQDPFPKPSYLFALVAGDLACLRDHYQTASGRPVLLEIYAEPHDIDKCQHAMQSLKDAMAWDERVYALEYDLDRYMIVAVGDFNMGAMENKGLNVFNTKYVLASPDTATDADYDGIASVIAHEYFHNWTGNRVTCRDWFQLSLKEGLTVFRDQCFSADMGSSAVARIEDVKVLRAAQFTEDAGAMAHPIRPQQYMEINNFYTATVYDKGAEVIRMLHTLLGEAGFQAGMRLYFARHDGQAVTTEDFLAAMADANGQDLSQFQHWYDYAGTPVVTVQDAYDAANQTYTLTVQQHCPATPEASHKPAFLIPMAMGLLDENGRDIPLCCVDDALSPTTRILRITQAEQHFIFTQVPCAPVPSLFRHLSAPVRVDYPYTLAQRAFLAAHDSDAFNRWDALQQLATAQIHTAMQQTVDFTPLQQAFAALLNDASLDPAFKALAVTLPSEAALADGMSILDVDALLHARQACEQHLARALSPIWRQVYDASCAAIAQSVDTQSAQVKGLRALAGVCLGYLAHSAAADAETLCQQHFKRADNMTDALAALRALNDTPFASRQDSLQGFYTQWQHEALVVDKWLALNASRRQPDALAQVQNLLAHPCFSLHNPNKVRNLMGVFSQNWYAFHRADGAGYALLADTIMALNGINPQVAARLCGAYSRWRALDAVRQAHICNQLDRILSQADVSPDVYEIASKYRQG